MNNNHYQVGAVFGLTVEMPFELVILHAKQIGGVLEEDGTKQDVA